MPDTGMTGATMRAARVDEIRGPVRVTDMPVPEIGPDDALVRVVASGICRSDWHIWNGDWNWVGIKLPSPAVLGHEMGGVVESVGANVRRVTPGTRVTVPFNLACGFCPYCRDGRQNLCDNAAYPMLLPGSGGWAQYARVPTADLNCIPLPQGVNELAAAALGCRYMTAWRGVRTRGGVRGGETVLVLGCGGVGLAAIEIATALGGRVIAADIDHAKLEAARKAGASETVEAGGLKAEEVGRTVKKRTGGGVDLAIDAFGSQNTVIAALRALRKGGRLAQIGLTSQQEKGQVTIPLDLLVNNEWQITGSLGNPHSAYPELLSMVAAGRLRPTALVSREVSLDEVGAVLHDMDAYRTTGYVVITRF
ncbi:MAG: alcohol dehydrogenase catalytic domain-containing protein [Acetobacteraceae bacterium]|nr:alcohol dehydrogenase catalytic domain-containing protein [Acetobacteraceae bacterium]